MAIYMFPSGDFQDLRAGGKNIAIPDGTAATNLLNFFGSGTGKGRQALISDPVDSVTGREVCCEAIIDVLQAFNLIV